LPFAIIYLAIDSVERLFFSDAEFSYGKGYYNPDLIKLKQQSY
jgi:hypothetical protein